MKFQGVPFFYSGIMYFYFILWIGAIVLGIYVTVLLIKFLKAGTEAFKIYINKNRN